MSNGIGVKTAIASGLAGALIGGVATAAISNAFHHSGHDYYVDKQFYKEKPDHFMCSIPLEKLITLPTANEPTTTTVSSTSTTSNDLNTTALSVQDPNKVIKQLQEVLNYYFNLFFNLFFDI